MFGNVASGRQCELDLDSQTLISRLPSLQAHQCSCKFSWLRRYWTAFLPNFSTKLCSCLFFNCRHTNDLKRNCKKLKRTKLEKGCTWKHTAIEPTAFGQVRNTHLIMTQHNTYWKAQEPTLLTLQKCIVETTFVSFIYAVLCLLSDSSAM